MTYFHNQLKQLHHQAARKKHLDAKLSELYTHQKYLADKTRNLKNLLEEEQKDVQRLEGGSLAAFFYSIIGKTEEKLDKERAEAYAVKLKYDAAVRELMAVGADIRSCEGELADLQGCEEQYQQALQEKAAAIRASGNPQADALVKMEERLSYLESQEEELVEAIGAGRAALTIAQRVMSRLDSAEGWSTWDVMGGGLLADMAKHSDLDAAQDEIENLQVQLGRFKTELADVKIDGNIQIRVGEFLHFADYFFDGLFADLAVMDKINEAQGQIAGTKNQIAGVLNRLEDMRAGIQQKQEQTKIKIDDFIVETSV